MPRPAYVLFALPLIVALAAPAVAGRSGQEGKEPPAEYVLEIDGQEVAVSLGSATTAKVGGRDVRVRLSLGPDRGFDQYGLSFRYPTTHNWEFDGSDPSALLWTLDGNDNVVMLLKGDKTFTPGQLRDELATSIAAQFGSAPVTRSKVTMTLEGRKEQGVELKILVGSAWITQQLYGLSTSEGTWVIVIQDTMDETGRVGSHETGLVKKLLTATLKTD